MTMHDWILLGARFIAAVVLIAVIAAIPVVYLLGSIALRREETRCHRCGLFATRIIRVKMTSDERSAAQPFCPNCAEELKVVRVA